MTLELLDYLQSTDGGEVQDQEDDERNKEMLAETMPAYAKSPEEELCADEWPQSYLVKEFNEKVKSHLSDEQMDFIYERFGACETLDEIAEELPPGEDGKPIYFTSGCVGKTEAYFCKGEEVHAAGLGDSDRGLTFFHSYRK